MKHELMSPSHTFFSLSPSSIRRALVVVSKKQGSTSPPNSDETDVVTDEESLADTVEHFDEGEGTSNEPDEGR